VDALTQCLKNSYKLQATSCKEKQIVARSSFEFLVSSFKSQGKGLFAADGRGFTPIFQLRFRVSGFRSPYPSAVLGISPSRLRRSENGSSFEELQGLNADC